MPVGPAPKVDMRGRRYRESNYEGFMVTVTIPVRMIWTRPPPYKRNKNYGYR